MFKILVPVDGSDYSKRALEQALSIAKGTNGDLTAIYVLEQVSTLFVRSQKVLSDANEKQKSDASRVLNESEVIAKEMGILKIDTFLVEGNTSPAEGIVEFGEKGNFNLIAMGSKGHGKLKQITIGSTSNKVLQQAKCSVLIAR